MSLAERWADWCEEMALGRVAPELWPSIMAVYNNPLRHYHTGEHIKDVIGRLDELYRAGYTLNVWPNVYMAAVFHDFVYDPRSKQNEEASALVCYSIAGSVISRNLVLATKHTGLGESRAAAALLDADLAGLGADFDTFWEAGLQIRREYAFVPLEAFVRGRTAFYESMLKRPIFSTDYFREKFEDQAKDNMRQAIDWMRMGRMIDA